MAYSLRYAHVGIAVAIILVASIMSGGSAQARQGELRPVRATVGCYEVRNWENNLVKVNPNLRHYHWNPIYVNVQGTRLVGPPPPPKHRLSTPPRKQELANKPSKRVLKVDPRNYSFKPAQERRNVYKQPTHMAPQRNTNTSISYKHVAPMRNTNTSLAYKHAAPSLSNRDMMGRLVPPNRPAEPPVTATQLEMRRRALMAKLNPPDPNALMAQQKKLHLAKKSVSGTLSHKDCSGTLAHKEVEGQLVARACTATLADPASAYVPYMRGDGNSRRQTKTNVNAQIRSY